MALQSLPPELLFSIFEFAWDHETLNSLPLVSKQLHDITLPLRHRCIALTKWETNHIRLSRISKELPTYSQVRHLFVSSLPPSVSEWMDVLKSVAPTLETLCVDIWSTGFLSCVYRVTFPRLRELTLNGYYSYPATLKMPALTRLHLAGQRNPFGLLAVGKLYDGLEVLQVSGVSAAPGFAREIKTMLARDGSPGEEGIPMDRFPPSSLKRINIHLGPETIKARKRSEEEMLDILRGLQKREGTGPKLCLVEDRLTYSHIGPHALLKEWKAGIDR